MSLSQNAKHTVGPPRPNDAMSIYHMGPKQIIIIFLSLTTALSNFPHEVEWEIENPIEKKNWFEKLEPHPWACLCDVHALNLQKIGSFPADGSPFCYYTTFQT